MSFWEAIMTKYKNKPVTINNKTYIIGESLGEGGNGCVRSARLDGREEYAIKFLKETEDQKKLARFLQEIAFCEMTNSPFVIKVYGHGDFHGKECYVMPKYHKTLKNVIESENNPLNLLKYSIQLCKAVEYIHDQLDEPVIHRDIKPENIFVSEDDKLVLADFGIAHFIDSSLTKTKDWLGNKSYAAPEQLLKDNAHNVTTACDIYAAGAIINELFTKENPAGMNYKTISEVVPALYPLDALVYRCLLQNPNERPTIKELLYELQLLYGDFCENVDDIMEHIYVDEILPTETINDIVNKASIDIIAAKYIFANASNEELLKYNTNYHRDIHYKLTGELKALYFQKKIYDLCLRKFNYEASAYDKGPHCETLDLSNATDLKICDSFDELVNKYKVTNIGDNLTGKILKLFTSCYDYHCRELLRDAYKTEEELSDFDDAPILYIVHKLRDIISLSEAKEIDLIDYISINWQTTAYDKDNEDSLIKAQSTEEEDILSSFQKEWGIVYSKIDRSRYTVKFGSKEDYIRFKEYALPLAKKSLAYEVDVWALLEINRQFDGIVELSPLNSFDIVSVLAKILEKQDD